MNKPLPANEVLAVIAVIDQANLHISTVTDRSKAVLLLLIICVIYVLCLSCFRVCSLLPCGHLLGMG